MSNPDRGSQTLLLNKPYGVLSQFTPEQGSRWGCLADWVSVPEVYAAGRLDADSEGLLLLTSNGRLQQRLTDPRFGHWRTYWAQVEGDPSDHDLEPLRRGLELKDGPTRKAKAKRLSAGHVATIAARKPPIRERRKIPTCWLDLELREGRNRQVRRMTAHVGHPTLRLVRWRIGSWSLDGLVPGAWRDAPPSSPGKPAKNRRR